MRGGEFEWRLERALLQLGSAAYKAGVRFFHQNDGAQPFPWPNKVMLLPACCKHSTVCWPYMENMTPKYTSFCTLAWFYTATDYRPASIAVTNLLLTDHVLRAVPQLVTNCYGNAALQAYLMATLRACRRWCEMFPAGPRLSDLVSGVYIKLNPEHSSEIALLALEAS